METSRLNVAIIGAGIAGLTCAITLSRYAGVHVTILERAPSLVAVRTPVLKHNYDLLGRILIMGTYNRPVTEFKSPATHVMSFGAWAC